jgi:hypothetical protein
MMRQGSTAGGLGEGELRALLQAGRGLGPASPLEQVLDCCVAELEVQGGKGQPEQRQLLALQVLLLWASAPAPHPSGGQGHGALGDALAALPTLRPLLHACHTPLLQSACSLLLARCLGQGAPGDTARFPAALLRDLRPLLALPATEDEQLRGLAWTRILCEVAPPLALELLQGEGVMEHLLGTLEYEGDAILHATLHLASAACSRKEMRELFVPWTPLFLDLQRRFARGPESRALHLQCLLVLVKLLPRAALLELARQEAGGPGLLVSLSLLLQEPVPATPSTAPLVLEQLHGIVELLLVCSVVGEFKEQLLTVPGLVDHLVKAAHQHASLLYGVAQLLSNLARFPDPLTQEQQDLLRLKRMHAAPGSGEAVELPSPLDERPCVERRCARLSELGALRLFALPPASLSRSPQAQEALARLALDLATLPALRVGAILSLGNANR